MRLNEKDKIIMECLMRDCRMHIKEIAKLAKLTHPGVLYRIKRLEENNVIQRYDALLNLNMLPVEMKIYLVNVSSKYSNAFDDYCIQNKSIMSVNRQIHYYNYLVFAPFSEKDENEFKNYLEVNKFDYKRYVLDNIKLNDFSLFDDVKVNIKQKSTKEHKLKIDKIDLKIIELMNEGCARDSVLELARKINTTSDIAMYRFKRLVNSGYFTNFIAQPNFEMNNIKYEFVRINSDLSFDEMFKTAKKTRRVLFFSQAQEGSFFLTFVAKNLEDFEKTLKFIQEELDERLLEIEVFFLKSWLFLNRLDLRRLFDVKD